MNRKQLRLLMIGAHPDDCDMLAGGTAIKYRRQGHIVKFISATNGDVGHHEVVGEKLAAIRAKEAENAGKIADAEYEVLDIHDNRIEADIETREKMISIIRQFKPDIVFTHRPYDYHPDHRKTSILVQDSSYALVIPNVCPHITPLLRMPVIMYFLDYFKKPYEFIPDVVVDTDDVFEEKVKMIGCHKSQIYEWLPWVEGKLDEVPKEDNERFIWLKRKQQEICSRVADCFREQLIRKYGEKKANKIKSAEAFELCEYGRRPEENELNKLFPF